MTKKLFIEGTSDDSNGNLRIGFGLLLSKKLSGRMPDIVLGGGKHNCIGKFRAFTRTSNNAYLLIDLDNPIDQKGNEILALNLSSSENELFFMVQEMEAWFLSQPDVLSRYYKVDLSGKIKGSVLDIEKPCKKMIDIIKKYTSKKTYHKVSDGAKLLAELNLDKLIRDFDDVQKLIDKLL